MLIFATLSPFAGRCYQSFDLLLSHLYDRGWRRVSHQWFQPVQPGPLTAFPGLAPVWRPWSTTSTPFTNT